MDEGTMAFETNDGRYLGVAFRGMKGKTVYPIVSAVWGHCEIAMKYIGGLDRKYFLFFYPRILPVWLVYCFVRERRPFVYTFFFTQLAILSFNPR